jgi:hypothetical protein
VQIVRLQLGLLIYKKRKKKYTNGLKLVLKPSWIAG